MPTRRHKVGRIGSAHAQVGDALHRAVLHGLVGLEQQLGHPPKSARIAQRVAVRLGARERSERFGGILQHGPVRIREHRHEGLDGDAQHVAVASVAGECGDNLEHADARSIEARRLPLPRVGRSERSDDVRERPQPVEHLARRWLHSQRCHGGGRVVLRLDITRAEQPHNGRDGVHVGEESPALVDIFEEHGERARDVLLDRIRPHGQHVEECLEAADIEDESPVAADRIRERERHLVLDLGGIACEEECGERCDRASALQGARRLLVLRRQPSESVDGLELHGHVRRVKELDEQGHGVCLEEGADGGLVAAHVSDGHRCLALRLRQRRRQMRDERHVPTGLEESVGGARVALQQVTERREAHLLHGLLLAEEELADVREGAARNERRHRTRHERSVRDRRDGTLLDVLEV